MAGSPFAYGETSSQNELEVSPCKWGLSVALGQDQIQLPINRLLRHAGNTVDQFFLHPTAHRGQSCWYHVEIMLRNNGSKKE